MKTPALWSLAAVVVIAAVVVEGSMIRRQRRAAAAALAEEKTIPPDPKIVSAPEIQVMAPAAPPPRAREARPGSAAGGRYANLLPTLRRTIPAAQLAILTDLLDAKEHVAGDALDAAREAGVDPALAAPEISRAVAQERAAIDERIKLQVGLPALKAVQQYEAAHPEEDVLPAPSPGAEPSPPRGPS